MSTTYRVQDGDTYDRIAKRVYGSGVYAGRIQRANPGAANPPTPGTDLVIPAIDPPNVPSVQTDDPDRVSVVIGGQRFENWTQIAIERRIDSITQVTVLAPFDPSNAADRALFRPFQFTDVSVFVGPDLLFFGQIVNVLPNQTAASNTVELQAYARAGTLWDCCLPAGENLSELEFNNQRIDEIAQSMVEPFGIGVSFLGPVGAPFPRVACSPTRTVADFLADIGRQRNFIFTDTPAGDLLGYQAPSVSAPVETFVEGDSAGGEFGVRFSGQDYYSHITGISPTDTGSQGGQYTAKNPHLARVLRPRTFTAQDSGDGDLQSAVSSKTGRMFGNMVEYAVTVPKWRDPAGRLYAPGTTVSVIAPGAMVYSAYNFIVASVEFSRTDSAKAASLGLVLPGSFRGEIPEALPWD